MWCVAPWESGLAEIAPKLRQNRFKYSATTMNGLISSLYGQRGSEAAELLYSPSVVQSNCSAV
jgi:hypothetical protein